MVYRVNKIRPMTLPCGMPKVRVMGSDVAPKSVPRSPNCNLLGSAS